VLLGAYLGSYYTMLERVGVSRHGWRPVYRIGSQAIETFFGPASK
jgi:hypothetical protein